LKIYTTSKTPQPLHIHILELQF